MTVQKRIGVAVTSVILLLCAFLVGIRGQLFSVSGRVDHPPAYGTAAVPPKSAGSVDPRTYDAAGNPLDLTAMSGHIDEIASDSDQCSDQRYIFAFQNMKLRKKNSLLAAVEAALQDEINAFLEGCPVSVDADFSCADGCETVGADDITVVQPLSLTMLSADGAGPGVLQYVFAVSGGCSRVRHCDVTTDSSLHPR